MSRARLSGGGGLYERDPTYFPHGRKRPISKSEKGYLASVSEAEQLRHFRVRNHSSGRPSYGGANRSSNIKREIGLKKTTVTLCLICGGTTPEVRALTEMFPLCRCGPFQLF